VADLQGFYDVFRTLEAFIRGEPRLAGFVDAAADLTEHARQLKDGATSVPRL
jgi:hypothetical protein